MGQRAIRHHLDGAHREVMVEETDLRAFAQQAVSLRAGTIHGFVYANFQFPLLVEFAVHIHVIP